MKKIAIMGAGGFGTALALVLARNRHDITLWDIDKNLIKHWQKIGKSDRYPFLANHKFPKNLKLSLEPKLNSKNYDFVIISSSMSGIAGTLERLNYSNHSTLVLIQKGMLPDLTTPTDVARKVYPKARVIQFTGAGFAKDLADKAPAGMIVVHHPRNKSVAYDFAKLFSGSNIWPTCSSDVFGVNIHNALRTIASFEQGFVYGYFERMMHRKPPVSTIAITFSAIGQEAKLLARELGASKEIHRIGSKVFRIIEADLKLCESDSSRNFALGHFMGKKFSLEESRKKVTEGVSECITNVSSIYSAVHKKMPKKMIAEQFPYLAAAKSLIDGGDIDIEMKKILAHHENFVT
ncbi:MAG: 2-dehydropantoate 2-reductase N-terminal domain-containing protein [Patescibacteria group bacterium]|jgi:glycerol-3-phosphate dehydrogenase (NAD(P)+)